MSKDGGAAYNWNQALRRANAAHVFYQNRVTYRLCGVEGYSTLPASQHIILIDRWKSTSTIPKRPRRHLLTTDGSSQVIELT